MEKRQLQWLSSVCGKAEPTVGDDYEWGDSEPCLCGDLRCTATVCRPPSHDDRSEKP